MKKILKIQKKVEKENEIKDMEVKAVQAAQEQYDIEYEEYSVCLFHPVTTEINYVIDQIECLTESLLESGKNYIIIYPNNDLGSNIIIENYNKINSEKIKILPSIRFEYFLTILKNSQFIIGNSSAGIREAPYYSIYSINIGTRQNKRDENSMIINVDFNKKNILGAINKASNKTDIKAIKNYGKGNSSELFVEILNLERFWRTENQKQFQDIN